MRLSIFHTAPLKEEIETCRVGGVTWLLCCTDGIGIHYTELIKTTWRNFCITSDCNSKFKMKAAFYYISIYIYRERERSKILGRNSTVKWWLKGSCCHCFLWFISAFVFIFNDFWSYRRSLCRCRWDASFYNVFCCLFWDWASSSGWKCGDVNAGR